MLKIVLFDFDGVIADSEEIHYTLIRKTLQNEGMDLNWKDYCEKYLVYDDFSAFRNILNDLGRDADELFIRRLYEQKAELYEDHIRSHSMIFPGVASLLQDLQENEILISIYSGAFRCEIEEILEQAGLRDFFLDIVTVEDVKAPKPDPEGYILAMQKANGHLNSKGSIKPGDCIVIEDSTLGVQAGKDAGMYCLAVETSYPSNMLGHADHVVKDLTRVDTALLNRIVGA